MKKNELFDELAEAIVWIQETAYRGDVDNDSKDACFDIDMKCRDLRHKLEAYEEKIFWINKKREEREKRNK